MTKGTLKPQRFITAVDMTHPEFTEQLSRELWKRIYEEVGLYSSLHCSPFRDDWFLIGMTLCGGKVWPREEDLEDAAARCWYTCFFFVFF